MDITIRLQVFEGPLDLLLYLIDKNKVNIYDIPIIEISAQYMEYLEGMKDRNLEVLSEFLVMASTLLEIKCRMLLPIDPDAEEGEEEDPRAQLVERLLEYKMYKCMAQELKDRSIEAGRMMFKTPTIPDEVKKYQEPVDLDALCRGYDLDRLNEIFQSVLRRQNDKTDPIRSKFGKIQKEEVSLEDKMTYLSDYASSHKHFSFRTLLTAASSRTQVVVTFLAILELMKTGKIRVSQEKLFDDIEIESLITEEGPGSETEAASEQKADLETE